jgi:hypothetical protein
MSWEHAHGLHDGYGYNDRFHNGYSYHDPGYYRYDEDGFDDDEDYRESASVRRRNIISRVHESSLDNLRLSGELWTSFPTMASFRPDLENLLAALESNRSLETITISKDILAIIGESDQGRLFCTLGSLPNLLHMTVSGGSPESPTVIHTRILAEALSQTSNGIKLLQISGFELSSRLEVEQLATGLKNRVATLHTLKLDDIVLDGEDKTGFLDPILLAVSPVPGEPHGRLLEFGLSCRNAVSNGQSIVSPEALGSFFACRGRVGQLQCGVYLQKLGLDDNHCKVVVEQMAKDDALRPIAFFDLLGNPSIGQEGYEAILGLLNKRFDIRFVNVDDQSWKAKFDLVIYMNREFDRGLLRKEGSSPSKAMQVNFLAKLAEYPYIETKMLNAIWYTLREDPDLMYT